MRHWLAELITWTLPELPDPSGAADRVVEGLLAAGDIGQGVMFGQAVLVPLRPQSVLLSNGETAAVGAWPDKPVAAHPDGLFPTMRHAPGAGHVSASLDGVRSGDATTSLLVDLSGGVPFSRVVERDLRRFLALEGRLDLRTGEWRLEEGALAALVDLAGSSPRGADAEGAPDPHQAMVILAPAKRRLIVEAGPGRGKTKVAARRIAALVEQGVAPSAIWLLSFTRVAVEAMRASLSGATGAGPPVHVSTFDSLAWNLVARLSGAGAAPAGSYERSVEAAVRLLGGDDPAVDAVIGGLEHVVVDEAQDLTGARLRLVDMLLSRLDPACGVTILGDPCQAIYGWRAHRGAGAPARQSRLAGAGPQPLLEDRPGFDRIRLQRDYRTEAAALARTLEEARTALLEPGVGSEARYHRVRDLIEAGAARRVTESGPDFPRTSNTMVLYRGRRALLAATHSIARRAGRFRVRSPGREDVVVPWIGAVLAGFSDGDRIRRADVFARLEALGPLLPPIDFGKAWDELLILSGGEGSSITVAQIHDRLRRPLPSRLTARFAGARGPLLGTIHSAKGLEADRVVLMLPPRPREDAGLRAGSIDWEEEARVLYVGASRARRELLIGSRRAGPIIESDLPGGRRWRGAPHDCSIEVGLDGDVAAPGGPGEGPVDARAAARRLLEAGGEAAALTGVLLDERRYALYLAADLERDEGGPVCVGCLDARFGGEVAQITGAANLPQRISGFWMLGCSTLAWSGDRQGVPARSVGLAPNLVGLAQFVSGVS